MNMYALMNHVSRHLHTIVRRYSKDHIFIDQVCERSGEGSTLQKRWDDQLSQYPEVESALLEANPSGTPKVISCSECVAYITIETEKFIFLTGPVLLTDETGYKYQFENPSYGHSWLLTLYSCGLMEFITETLILYNLFHEEILTPQEVAQHNCLTDKLSFDVQKKFTDIIFENQENSQKHNPYDQEVREISSIRNGDLKQLEESISEDYVGNVGTLAKTQLRNFQNLAIVLITLASRAAIEGGVMPEIAYSLSDSYIQKVEQLHIPEAAIQLARQAEYQYTSMVYEIKHRKDIQSPVSQSDFLLNQCKDFIFLHLHEKISTSHIAKALFVNPNYLSGVFKKKEGITISEYILNEKIRLVKNMLVYSPYSYSTIASYLGFSSQSHLSRQFKKAIGMTLQQYRVTYGKTDNFLHFPDKKSKTL